MLAFRRLAVTVCQAGRWDKLVSSHTRCLSLSPCTLKRFPTSSQQKVVFLPSDQKEITVDELLKLMRLGRKKGIIGTILSQAGIKVHIANLLDTVIPMDLAELLVLECKMIPAYSSTITQPPPDNRPKWQHEKNYKLRPPVVTIMGHVDHGKTTLLDYLRNTAIASTEAGGITQHVGAFQVKLKDDQMITFIDTPGHAAFNNMRERGAYVTDIVVLVIAADDGVKAQTVESLKYILPDNIPVIVALNKIDKPNINVEAVKSQLLGYGLFLEEVGGDVQCVEISALKGTNIPSLIEAVLAQAEVTSGLSANFAGNARGIILESRMDSKIGPVATVIVGEGELKVGSFVIAGNTWAKVKALKDWENNAVKLATPSMPVLVTGWKDVPNAGNAVVQVASKEFAMEEIEKRRSNTGKAVSQTVDIKPVTARNLEILETLRQKKQTNQELEVHPKLKYNDTNRVDLVIKGDVTGSVEAVLEALKTFKSNQILLSVLHAGVGNVTESDVTTVAAFKGTILAFNVRAMKGVKKLAATSGVTIKHYSVIYTLLNELKEMITAKLPPVRVDTEKGRAIVLQKFKLTGTRKSVVAGCNVRSGVLSKEDSFKVLRFNKTIYEGKLSTMKRGMEEATSVSSGSDCGLAFEDFSEFDQGDNIICFTSEYVKPELDWEFGF